jgi:hypothetical protein
MRTSERRRAADVRPSQQRSPHLQIPARVFSILRRQTQIEAGDFYVSLLEVSSVKSNRSAFQVATMTSLLNDQSTRVCGLAPSEELAMGSLLTGRMAYAADPVCAANRKSLARRPQWPST